ncbi:ATP-grasp fold amidoligase family protein [Alkalihalobacterium elongatum]|uniref:ATP-grasp fold amidoligase family protein n=1 Tax=Alkalihalobacterium elongatum TaxID=2675466 RepID=UPI001C1F5543|nr:ATP-grasp fold amidoligase family protein [Alkalihalobacterium elongatum]
MKELKNSSSKPETQTEDRLLDKLIKQEAELQKLQKEKRQLQKQKDLVEKNYKTITKSPYYKYSWPLRKSINVIKGTWHSVQTAIYGSKYKLTTEENQKLKAKTKKLQKELFVAKEKLKKSKDILEQQQKRETELLLKLEEIDREALLEKVKAANEKGEIIEFLDSMVENRSIHDAKYCESLKQAAKLFINKDDDLKRLVYEKVLTGLKIEEIPEFIIRSAETADSLSLHEVASFRASLSMRARQRQLDRFVPEWMLDNKVDAYSFIDQLGVRRPWVSIETYTFKEIPPKEKIVIKPFDGAGSRGVYLVHSPTHIQDVKRSEIIQSWDELQAYLKADLASGWVEKDEWITEELVLESETEKTAARDLKFYCFYGKVALILEIIRFPEVKYCWWTAAGEQVATGKYEDDRFEGNGVTEAQIQIAEKISAEIPAPFMRIDFLKSGDELVFGEFTPKPGHYDHFDNNTDRLLGEYFLEAEGRLVKDLLLENKFTHFISFLEQSRKIEKL